MTAIRKEAPASLPTEGFVRLPQVLAVMGIKKTAWWDGVKSGRFPKPIKLSPTVAVWDVEEIRTLLCGIRTRAGGTTAKPTYSRAYRRGPDSGGRLRTATDNV